MLYVVLNTRVVEFFSTTQGSISVSSDTSSQAVDSERSNDDDRDNNLRERARKRRASETTEARERRLLSAGKRSADFIRWRSASLAHDERP